MPYIKQDRRIKLQDVDKTPFFEDPITAGEINFLITRLIVDYWRNKMPNYQGINDVIGALEGAKLEFYRRIAVPYEDKKIKANGDVY